MTERSSYIDTALLSDVARMFVPEFVEYRGGVFRADAFDAHVVDDWFERLAGDVRAVEDVVNHVHLFDVVTDDYDGDEAPDLWAVALLLAEAWRALLPARFPHRQFRISCEIGYGPEVSFAQATEG